jgi:4-hydroxybenzoate polyprenyltransferase
MLRIIFGYLWIISLAVTLVLFGIKTALFWKYFISICIIIIIFAFFPASGLPLYVIVGFIFIIFMLEKIEKEKKQQDDKISQLTKEINSLRKRR